MIWRAIGLGLAGWLAIGAAAASPRSSGGGRDDRLDAARRFVEKSDRYLHHDKLRRGMEGYGLTVLAGSKIVRFKATIVSVLTRWGPHQDVIIAKLSGQNLEKTGIVSGMSGSPVYMRDGADGKDKLIGAIAYGWRAQKEPLCGIQPITQMLAAGEYYKKLGKASKADARSSAAVPGGLPARPATGRRLEDFLATVLDPRKIDFVALECSRRAARPARPPLAAPSLVPLTTPLMVSGTSRRGLAELSRCLEPMGIVPVASGGVGAAEAKAAGKIKLEPGAALAVPLVVGDADYAAVGTVTEVVGDHVLAFGHSFYAEGDVELPIGPAYVHTVVSGLMSSFKLSSGLDVAGTLKRDENVGVGGLIGPVPPMIPMNVTIEWTNQKRKQSFRYRLCKHRRLTVVAARSMLYDIAWGWHELPEQHTVRYTVAVDFGRLGKYRSSNIAAGSDVYPVLSDLTRPIYGLMDNPLAKPVAPRRIDVSIRVAKGDLSANMLAFKLDGEVYRPGETVAGTLTIRPFRKPRKTLPVRFKLPDDLPEGAYTLTVCDATSAVSLLRSEMPHKFFARTTQELFDAIQRVVEPPASQLYLRLPLPDGGGLALAQRELPDLPQSKATILSQAGMLDTRSFSRSIVRTLKTDRLITGSASARFRVEREPAETRLRK